ncbi:hypothetical protein [Roseivirga sp.]|uniref:hypothetical protein n=1 Tax=Roseivirga sp. TaxID=1964215 RepID=UPI002B27B390|nr:hypothetical protein [Roseivirga sp.]
MKAIVNLLLLVFISSACSTPQNSAQDQYVPKAHFDQNWAMDKLWEDGLAEVAHYRAELNIYGKTRSFDQVFVTVKEEFNKEWNVKTDDYKRDDLFSVMKVNKFARIETDNYPYHYLSSLFFKRDQPDQLYKMTHTGQEWCGNTFKQFLVEDDHYAYDYNSYFDGKGDGEMEISGTDFLWEDQLSYALRALNFEDGLTFNARLLEAQINTKVKEPILYNAQFSVVEKSDTWQVEVKLDAEKTNVYLFEKEYPNLLRSQQSWNGYKLELDTVSRYQYWR